MNGLTLIILIILLVSILFVVFRKKSNKALEKELEAKELATLNPNEGAEEVPWKKNNDLNITTEEKLELSWSFLYKITDVVLQNFNEDDKQALKDLGKVFSDGGMNYQHVVEYGITKEALAAAKKAKQSDQQQIA